MAFRDTSDLHYWDADDEDPLRCLRARFLRWRIWRGKNEHMQPVGWYASRLEAVPDEVTAQGLRQTVDASNADELALLLEEQDRLFVLVVTHRLDVRVPNVARMYDYYLGGKDNYAADRDCADEVIRRVPQIREMARENRAFLRRVVRYLTGEVGIDQFLDIGAGLPTQENVHQIARRISPDARVVYVDNDPMVLRHGQALLATEAHTWVIKQDVRRPEHVIAAIDALGLLDLSRPVAVLLVAILHFISDEEDPYRIVKTLIDALPAGSYLVISHVERRADLEQAAGIYQQASSAVTLRTAKEITRLFDGMTLVGPGLVPVGDWHPDALAYLNRREHMPICVGVGRKDD